MVLWELVTLGKFLITQLMKHEKFNIVVAVFFNRCTFCYFIHSGGLLAWFYGSCNSASMKPGSDSM